MNEKDALLSKTNGNRLKDYINVILRRKLVILISILSVAGSTYFYVANIEDTFESFSTLVIEEKNPIFAQTLNVRQNSLSFYQGILDSRTFIEMVLDSVGMDIFNIHFPRFTRADAQNYIHQSITLRKTPYASFLRLTAQAKSKQLSYFIASTATELFIKRCREVETEESRRAMVEIDKQLTLVRKKLEEAEQQYRTFRDRAGNILEGTTPELNTLQEAYASDLAQLGLKEADLKAEKKQLSKLEKMVTPDDKRNNPEISKLRSKLRELEKEKLRLENMGIRLSSISTIDREIQEIEKQLLLYKGNNRKKRTDLDLIRQWQELRKSVINKEAELELFKRRLHSYKNAISSYKKDNPDILNQALELLKLKRSKEIYEDIYTILLEKAEEERIRGASNSGGLKIVDIARMPQQPMPKNQTQYYILGLLLGLGLGLAMAFLIEFNDTSIKSAEDVERYLEYPVMGTIPHIQYNRKSDIEIKRRSNKKNKSKSVTVYPRHLLNFSGSDSVTTESYRSLRTNLSFVSPDNPIKSVLLTSAGPSEGKSLTISNLAMAYAQMGKRTLLVDTDLRRPVLHHLFGLKREPGFTDLFIENPQYDKTIRKTEKENLYLVTAGMFTPNPAELIGSQKMVQHIDYFKTHFDMVFFDTPPIVAVTDATLLGTKLDGVLLVIRSHHTDREISRRALRMLSNVNVKILGAVLNDIDLTHRYSSYGYYRYYYNYNKS
ncbi:MAG: polysaccharide biosynthesis tyrosine autokinase [Chitinispirillaceae bacterium]